MTSKSLIPEMVIGILSIAIGIWSTPILLSSLTSISSEPYRATVDVNSMAYFNLLFSSLSCVLLGLLFFIIGGYLVGIAADALFSRNQKEKGVD